MTLSMHKNSINSVQKLTSNKNMIENDGKGNSIKSTIIVSNLNTISDVARENRMSEILSLHSKGYNQMAIAQTLGVNQSTISRDLQLIKKTSRNHIENYISNDIPFEFRCTLIGLEDLIKKSWQILDDHKVPVKHKHNFVALLESLYIKRLQLFIGGDPKERGSFPINLNRYISQIKEKEMYNFE